MKGKFLAVFGLASLALIAPAQAQNSDLIGALLGGVGGAVAGAQFGKGKGQLAATAVGALGGALVGRSVGQSVDRANDAYYTSTPTYYAPPQPAYVYPASAGTVYYAPPYYHRPHYYYPPPAVVYAPPPPPPPVAAPQVVTNSGQYCREYTAPITIDGHQVEGYGQACQQPDGSWKLGPLQPVR